MLDVQGHIVGSISGNGVKKFAYYSRRNNLIRFGGSFELRRASPPGFPARNGTAKPTPSRCLNSPPRFIREGIV